MIDVLTAPTSELIVRVSVVSGVTVNACVENTTSAVCPAVRRSSKSSTLRRARATRDGSTSPASIERDRSSATTSASSERNAGTGSRSHAGPASATSASTPHASSAISGQRLSRSTSGSASTCERSGASTSVRQPPPSERPRRTCQISQIATGSSASHHGRKKWKSAMADLAAQRDGRRASAPPARCDRAERRRERQHERRAERPVKELRDGPEAALVGRGGLELI